MTSQDWKEVEEKLDSFYTLVNLNCDGYIVTLCLKRIDQFKNGICVYVNDYIRGKWLTEDCEERRRFMRPVEKYAYSQKMRASLKKISKRLRNKMGLPDPEKKITFYAPYWTSFKRLKSHLIKNNVNIEMIREQAVIEDVEKSG